MRRRAERRVVAYFAPGLEHCNEPEDGSAAGSIGVVAPLTGSVSTKFPSDPHVTVGAFLRQFLSQISFSVVMLLH